MRIRIRVYDIRCLKYCLNIQVSERFKTFKIAFNILKQVIYILISSIEIVGIVRTIRNVDETVILVLRLNAVHL